MSENAKVHIGFKVSESERNAWQKHADELNMPYAEYYRSMIRAGRRNIDFSNSEESENHVINVEDQLRKQLSDEQSISFETLAEQLTEDIKYIIEETLIDMDDVQYRPQENGYTIE